MLTERVADESLHHTGTTTSCNRAEMLANMFFMCLENTARRIALASFRPIFSRPVVGSSPIRLVAAEVRFLGSWLTLVAIAAVLVCVWCVELKSGDVRCVWY